MAINPGFQLVEHTADVGIKAYGGSMTEALEYAVKGMFSLILSPQSEEGRRTWEVSVAAPDPDLLLFNFLDELLYLHHTQHMVVTGVDSLIVFQGRDVEDADDVWRLQAQVSGYIVDPSRHSLGTEIKAVTLHGLSLQAMGDGGWEAQVIFDL